MCKVKHNTCGKARCVQLALNGLHNARNDSGSVWIAVNTPDCCARLRYEYESYFTFHAHLTLRSFSATVSCAKFERINSVIVKCFPS